MGLASIPLLSTIRPQTSGPSTSITPKTLCPIIISLPLYFHLHYEERLARITGIGWALHFLVVQHELGEPLNLMVTWHAIFDSHWRPPLCRRVRDSQFKSTEAIPVTVSTDSKRRAEEQLESSKGPKRPKLEEPKKAKARRKTKNSGAGTMMAGSVG
ncbi:hypothetical protein B0H16DRAFT_1472167 [Mycena metata]|uniref:Uncharacterized protein n=1 Tax=Mycena metata TaxID=1033252 RepID=A0AAD7HPY6_9AGAR|nr:hypothetical protein B0H16DRAFT_1472167 [Mycena metata]